MDKCVLIKPSCYHERDIQNFRKEMLDANSSMDGTGPLKRMENIKEWLEFNQRCEMPELWDILDESGNKTGRLCERGTPMHKGEYHLVIQVWIKNSKNEYLISRRTNNGGWWSGLWQTTGGAAVTGDNSLETALKETREEIGIMLEPKNGQLFKRYSELHKNDDGSVFIDVWLFRQDFDIATVVFQPEETCDAMWASKEKIKQMIDDGHFIPPQEAYPYIDELFYKSVF